MNLNSREGLSPILSSHALTDRGRLQARRHASAEAGQQFEQGPKGGKRSPQQGPDGMMFTSNGVKAMPLTLSGAQALGEG